MSRLRFLVRWGLPCAAFAFVGCQAIDPPVESPTPSGMIYPGVPNPISNPFNRQTGGIRQANSGTAGETHSYLATVSAHPTAPDASGPVVQLPPQGDADTIDLGIALRLGGVDNPTINIAREQIREALAGQLAARSLLLPTINVGGNYHHHNGPLEASPGFIQTPNQQALYLGFGARTLAAETIGFPGIRLFAHLGDAVYEPLAARQQVTTRRSTAQAVQNTILLDVATAYLSLVAAEARLTILHQAEADLGLIVKETQDFAKTGQGRLADAKRAETHAELLQREIRQAEEETAVASTRLCRLLNLDPSSRVRTPGGPVEPFRLTPEDADAEALVMAAIRMRPEVMARAAQIREAQTRIRQERVRPFLPLLSVGYSGGAFGGGSNIVSTQFGPLNVRNDFDVMALWTAQNMGFGNLARVRQADAVFAQAMSGYDLSINQIRREVIEAIATARSSARQIEISKQAVAEAEEGFRLEQDRIRGGLGRPIETLDTFKQLVAARQELLRAIVGFDIAQFQLFVAVGRNPLSSDMAQQP